ncbi:MAG: AAA family ATPase [Candidatus Latescibacteria bacterium]|nr:AAA family ATPase [Candidatus Latescibacterota bacterium]
MYQEYWNLTELPFESVPDPRFFYSSGDHQRALLQMFYAINNRMGAAVLTGDLGCGKTVVSRMLIHELSSDQYEIALINRPSLSPIDFLRDMLGQLGVDIQSDARMQRALEVQAVKSANAGKYTVVIVDDADAIEDDNTFEELQSLFNFQRNGRFFLTLLLIGQAGLKYRVEGIESLAQQVARQYHLAPFKREETDAYVQTRLKKAGADRSLFNEDALDALYQASNGVPRNINNICDVALLLGFDAKAKTVGEEQIEKAVYAVDNL